MALRINRRVVLLVIAAVTAMAGAVGYAPGTAAADTKPPPKECSKPNSPREDAVIESWVLGPEYSLRADGFPQCGNEKSMSSDSTQAVHWELLAREGDAAPNPGGMTLEQLALQDHISLERLRSIEVWSEFDPEPKTLTRAEALGEEGELPYFHGEGASAAESVISLIRPGTGGQGISSGERGPLWVVFKEGGPTLELGPLLPSATVLTAGEKVEFQPVSLVDKAGYDSLPECRWNFGDGTMMVNRCVEVSEPGMPASGEPTQHTYQPSTTGSETTYRVTVEVIAHENGVEEQSTGTRSISLTVKNPEPSGERPPPPPPATTEGPTGAGTAPLGPPEAGTAPTRPTRVGARPRSKPHRIQSHPNPRQHHHIRHRTPTHRSVRPSKPANPPVPKEGTNGGRAVPAMRTVTAAGTGPGGTGHGPGGNATHGGPRKGNLHAASSRSHRGPHTGAPTPDHRPKPLLASKPLELQGVLVSAGAGGVALSTPTAGSEAPAPVPHTAVHAPPVSVPAPGLLALLAGIACFVVVVLLGAVGEVRPRWFLP